MNNEGLSEIDGPFPVPPPRDNRERNDNQEQREEATGTSAVCKPLLPSIIVIGSRPIMTSPTEFRACVFSTLSHSRIRIYDHFYLDIAGPQLYTEAQSIEGVASAMRYIED